ncbi:MAG: nuclear transport factor 2 family protein, partial [Proteobacteria bacterium]|nr:nuclear transport factor 2 family protein [Pseudomonadota bacterium]
MTNELNTQIEQLADIEAIRKSKHRYAAFLDDNYDAEGCATLFAEDAVWDGGSFGRHEGRDAIREF